jgi:hypothetical protein
MRIFPLLLIPALVWTGPARAQDPPADRPVAEALRVAPDACLDRDRLAAHVAGWIHRDRLDRRIAIDVARDEGPSGGVTLTLIRDDQVVGERRLAIPGVPCEEARAAVGLAIAVAIDNTLLQSLQEGAPPPALPSVAAPTLPLPVTASRTAPPSPDPHEEPPADPVPRAPQRTGLGMSIDVAAMAGPLPSLVFGVAPAFEIVPHPRIEIRLGALATTPSTFSLGTGRVAAEIFTGRADGCAVLPVGAPRAARPPLRLHLCAGLLAGAIHTSVVSGLAPSPSPTAPWVAAALRFDVRVALTERLGLRLAVDGLAPLTRPDVEATLPDGTVADTHPLAPAGFAVAIGPHVIFR